LQDADLKKLDLFKKIFKKSKEKFKKEWKTEQEAEKLAEKKALSILKSTLSYTAKTLKFFAIKLPLTVAWKLIKYSFFLTVIWWWALAVDYYPDQELDSIKWLKWHFWDILWIWAGAWVWNVLTWGSRIWRILGAIWWKKLYDIMKQNWIDIGDLDKCKKYLWDLFDNLTN
jgi:hypothetical protein